MIYVFNLSATYVEYSVNDGRIPPGQPMIPDLGYRPNSTAVKRVRFKEPGCFAQGENRFFVRFRDQLRPFPNEAVYTVDVPAGSSLSDDFLFYVFRTQAAFLDHSGRVMASFWPSANTLTPNQV